jgi:hypothetical protein
MPPGRSSAGLRANDEKQADQEEGAYDYPDRTVRDPVASEEADQSYGGEGDHQDQQDHLR